jgi:hypothetical protein
LTAATDSLLPIQRLPTSGPHLQSSTIIEHAGRKYSSGSDGIAKYDEAVNDL